MKITVLCENTSARGLPCEHGLSLYIEACGKKILFDTGQTGLFANNAKTLGADLGTVDFAVLSHGHYDHGGGIKEFLQLNKTAPVYITKGAFAPHFNAAGLYIGIDTALENCGRLIFCGDKTEIAAGLTLYTCNGKARPVPTDPFGLTEETDGVRTPDRFLHEQYLLINENGKRVLISGCSHKGIINLTEWFMPDHLIGGFHFMKLEPGDELKEYAVRLDGYPVTYHTCHCTGEKQYAFMKRYMQRLYYISTGDVLEI